MSVCQLRIEGKVGWEMDYHLPLLWPWLFDPARITESRRLHTTAFAAAERFEQCRARVEPLPHFRELLGIFDHLEPAHFPRDLDTHPDAVISLDLGALEGERHYDHEAATARWESFFQAADAGDEAPAFELWHEAAFNPLVLYRSQQQAARSLSARAVDLGLDREARARALVWHLFGRPVTRPTTALSLRWEKEAERLPGVGYREKRTWWGRVLGRMKDEG